jgi:arsenate reductase (thioredoxin)
MPGDAEEFMFNVLFLCTENACRSQMAEGLVNHDLAGQVKAFSAGVRPSRVNPRAIQVMAELGIDISHHRSKSVDELAGEHFDLVITVCDRAAQQCPMFPGDTEIMHVGFPGPGPRPRARRRKYSTNSAGCGIISGHN